MDGNNQFALRLTPEERNRIRKPCRNSLILKLIGGSLRFSNLQLRLKRLWKIQSAFQVSDLGGPRFLNDRYLSVQRWVPNFRASTNQLPATMAIWVQLPELPVEYYDPVVLQQISSMIGTPIKADVHTNATSRTQYARICVEVELGKTLPSSIDIEGTTQHVGYEVKTAFCLSCGQIGHKRQSCAINLNSEKSLSPDVSMSPEKSASTEEWRLIERTQRRRRQTRREEETLAVTKEAHDPIQNPRNQETQIKAHVDNQGPSSRTKSKQHWQPKLGQSSEIKENPISNPSNSNSFSILADLEESNILTELSGSVTGVVEMDSTEQQAPPSSPTRITQELSKDFHIFTELPTMDTQSKNSLITNVSVLTPGLSSSTASIPSNKPNYINPSAMDRYQTSSTSSANTLHHDF
ncbi:hypothetical protein COLO4_28969 [Corchorus olitorius]|uniref:CCHC-type domain-containing protein n=1 Tax=Corchorus olitorius TaxID=93759 RepID=A0A1R3HH90_9ROSI|nr:hypothetical protein COLO4_28969 [Corchorus olitorius]